MRLVNETLSAGQQLFVMRFASPPSAIIGLIQGDASQLSVSVRLPRFSDGSIKPGQGAWCLNQMSRGYHEAQE